MSKSIKTLVQKIISQHQQNIPGKAIITVITDLDSDFEAGYITIDGKTQGFGEFDPNWLKKFNVIITDTSTQQIQEYFDEVLESIKNKETTVKDVLATVKTQILDINKALEIINPT